MAFLSETSNTFKIDALFKVFFVCATAYIQQNIDGFLGTAAYVYNLHMLCEYSNEREAIMAG